MRKIIIIAILLISACLSYGQNKAERLSITEKNYLAYKICKVQSESKIHLFKENISDKGIYKFNKEQIYTEYDSSVSNVLSYYDYMHTYNTIDSYRLPSTLDKNGLAVYIVYDEYNRGYALGITDSGSIYLFYGFKQNDFHKFVAHYFNKIDNEDKAWNVCKLFFDISTFSPYYSEYEILITNENIKNYQEYLDIVKPAQIKNINGGYQVLYYFINSATKAIYFVNIITNYNGEITYDYKIIKEPECRVPDIFRH